MTLSEVIKELQEIYKKEGDIEIVVNDYDAGCICHPEFYICERRLFINAGCAI